MNDLLADYELDHPQTLDGLDGPITLVNHFALRSMAVYGDLVGPMRSGLEAMLLYSQVSTERLAAVGGQFAMQGVHIGSLWGDDERWDLVVVANYPSPDSLLDLLADEAYRDAFVHRRAAVERQRVAICSTIA